MQILNKMFRKYDFYVFNKRLNYVNVLGYNTHEINNDTKDRTFKARQESRQTVFKISSMDIIIIS